MLDSTTARACNALCNVADTRKSTTIGFEQEFSSLDAQRESCLSYIGKREDWLVVDEKYDDGGFTGRRA